MESSPFLRESADHQIVSMMKFYTSKLRCDQSLDVVLLILQCLDLCFVMQSESKTIFITMQLFSKMNQAQTLKNLMENGTSIEYFNNGYIMQVKDKIKVCEEGKKAATTLTQAQQTKLLLEARGGGQTKQPKRTLKRHVENNNDEAEGETPGNERKYSYDYPMNIDDDEQDDQQIIVEQPKGINTFAY
ncbi:MAG: hypothetical protein EZS28_016959 [Streblomastix strix]|uniref:Uncharacterized protein n=1 Tax=Streblomastix strix TaxID=222440 RepID=A0A5J4VXX7_9EUKA|nr:MAG: hypothetical protein EZS28_016959 [Streblomastix strix]